MTFSEYSGTAFIPTLARVVLAGIFITSGYHKCFVETEYTAEQAATLRQLEFGIGVAGDAGETDESAGLWNVNGIEIVPASFVQDETQDTGGTTGGDDTQDPPPTGGDDVTGGADDAADDNQDAGGADEVVTQDDAEELVPPTTTPAITGSMTAKKAGHVALMVHEHGWPQPKLMAWLASLTELVGGALILVGLFSRLWGAGLAVTMAVAFYFTSWAGLADGSFNLFAIYEDNAQLFSSMFLQLSLLVLAMLVLFAGPGPLSIDRLLFGKAPTDDEVEL